MLREGDVPQEAWICFTEGTALHWHELHREECCTLEGTCCAGGLGARREEAQEVRGESHEGRRAHWQELLAILLVPNSVHAPTFVHLVSFSVQPLLHLPRDSASPESLKGVFSCRMSPLLHNRDVSSPLCHGGEMPVHR
jgi:hypothetical protein